MHFKKWLFKILPTTVTLRDSLLDSNCHELKLTTHCSYCVYWPTIFPYGLNRSSKSFFSMSEVGKFPTKILLSKSLGSLLLQEREKRPGEGLRLLRRDMTRSQGLPVSSCVSNAWKSLVCLLIIVFKLSSTILKCQWVKRGDQIPWKGKMF